MEGQFNKLGFGKGKRKDGSIEETQRSCKLYLLNNNNNLLLITTLFHILFWALGFVSIIQLVIKKLLQKLLFCESEKCFNMCATRRSRFACLCKPPTREMAPVVDFRCNLTKSAT